MIVDEYIYLLLSIPFLLLSLLIFIRRPDLRLLMLFVGIIGGVIGWITNAWYFVDYWRPLSLFGQAVYSVEDFLAGVGITTLSAFGYAYIAKHRLHVPRTALKLFSLLLLAGLTTMLITVNLLHFNSLIVSTTTVFVMAAMLAIGHSGIIKPALLTGILLTLVGSVTYWVLFGILSPSYLESYFLLTNQPYNPTLFGFLPLLELWWYFSWGVFAASLVYRLTRQEPL